MQFSGDEQQIPISDPSNFTQVIEFHLTSKFEQLQHVGWNPSTQNFEGLPNEWQTMLKISGIISISKSIYQ